MPIPLLVLTIEPVWLLWWPRISVRGTRYLYMKAIEWKMRLEMSFAFGGSLQEPRPWSPKATQFHKMPQGSYWILSSIKTTNKCVIDAKICLTHLWSSKSLQHENNSWTDNSKQTNGLKYAREWKGRFISLPWKSSLHRSRGLKEKTDNAFSFKLRQIKVTPNRKAHLTWKGQEEAYTRFMGLGCWTSGSPQVETFLYRLSSSVPSCTNLSFTLCEMGVGMVTAVPF